MNATDPTSSTRSIAARSRPALALILAGTTAALIGIGGPVSASTGMATAALSLGAAANFAVLAASTVTNTGNTTINGDVGLSPGTATTGFPPGRVNGTIYAADSVASQAQLAVTAAYNAISNRKTTAVIPVELGGTTLTPGVYASAAGTFGITGTLTLNAEGNKNAIFIFKAASTLITASSSEVTLINGARAGNVYWQVGSSATLGTYSILQGNVLALASVTVTTGATVYGRALARTAAVTLDTDTIAK
jgi:Ice-binding-like